MIYLMLIIGFLVGLIVGFFLGVYGTYNAKEKEFRKDLTFILNKQEITKQDIINLIKEWE